MPAQASHPTSSLLTFAWFSCLPQSPTCNFRWWYLEDKTFNQKSASNKSCGIHFSTKIPKIRVKNIDPKTLFRKVQLTCTLACSNITLHPKIMIPSWIHSAPSAWILCQISEHQRTTPLRYNMTLTKKWKNLIPGPIQASRPKTPLINLAQHHRFQVQ
jgi:hypothetical protein